MSSDGGSMVRVKAGTLKLLAKGDNQENELARKRREINEFTTACEQKIWLTRENDHKRFELKKKQDVFRYEDITDIITH